MSETPKTSGDSVQQGTPEQEAALDRYWTARTPQQEREALAELRALGLPAGYGEDREATDPKTSWTWQRTGRGEWLVSSQLSIARAEERAREERLDLSFRLITALLAARAAA